MPILLMYGLIDLSVLLEPVARSDLSPGDNASPRVRPSGKWCTVKPLPEGISWFLFGPRGDPGVVVPWKFMSSFQTGGEDALNASPIFASRC